MIPPTGDALRLAAISIGGAQMEAEGGPTATPQLAAQFGGALSVLDGLFDALTVAVMLAAISLVARIVRRDALTPVHLIVLIWLVFTPLVFSITSTTGYQHYIIIMLPSAYLSLATCPPPLALSPPAARE